MLKRVKKPVRTWEAGSPGPGTVPGDDQTEVQLVTVMRPLWTEVASLANTLEICS